MKVRYHGGEDARVIAETGQTVKRGETIDVPAELARRLGEQQDFTLAGGGAPAPSRDELAARARELGIEIPPRAKKADIAVLVAAAESEGQDPEDGSDETDTTGGEAASEEG